MLYLLHTRKYTHVDPEGILLEVLVLHLVVIHRVGVEPGVGQLR